MAKNMISSTYIAVIVNFASMVLPKLGVTIGSEQLTTTVQTLVAIASGLWVLVQRYKRGDVTLFGSYK